jgi:hypothetical protein
VAEVPVAEVPVAEVPASGAEAGATAGASAKAAEVRAGALVALIKEKSFLHIILANVKQLIDLIYLLIKLNDS